MTEQHEATYIHVRGSTETIVVCEDCDWSWYGESPDGQHVTALHNHQKEEGIIF